MLQAIPAFFPVVVKMHIWQYIVKCLLFTFISFSMIDIFLRAHMRQAGFFLNKNGLNKNRQQTHLPFNHNHWGVTVAPQTSELKDDAPATLADIIPAGDYPHGRLLITICLTLFNLKGQLPQLWDHLDCCSKMSKTPTENKVEKLNCFYLVQCLGKGFSRSIPDSHITQT